MNWYSYCGGNPILKIDPYGLADFIYTSKEEYRRENEYIKISNTIYQTPDRYFIEADRIRYQVNSIETIGFYFAADEADRQIITGFGDRQMYDMMTEAQKKGVSLKNVLGESINGHLDFKLQLNKSSIYEINGIYYNANEAGNYMWSYTLRINNHARDLDDILAQGGSIFFNKRLDESWDAVARYRGEADAHIYSGLSRKYGASKVITALKEHGRIPKEDIQKHLKK